MFNAVVRKHPVIARMQRNPSITVRVEVRLCVHQQLRIFHVPVYHST